MLCNRIKQFREYNNLSVETLSKVLGVDEDEYLAYESGKITPNIDTITLLAEIYKVTLNEFYGYTPFLHLHSNIEDEAKEDEVPDGLLKMSDLSWDEKQLLLHYRTLGEKKEDIVKLVLEKRFGEDSDNK